MPFQRIGFDNPGFCQNPGLFDYIDSDNIGPNFDSDARAVTDKIGRTYHFWRGTFGRDSYDDDGEQIEFNIHVRYLN